MLVDSHCHLDFPDFADELDAMVARARAAGIGAHGHDLDARAPVRASCAASPSDLPMSTARSARIRINAHEELDVTAADLVALHTHPKVVAIGEAGLDYHYDYSPRDAQERGFRRHIAAARETGLPLVIHAREADADIGAHPRGGNREGRLPGRAALLHRRPRARPPRHRSRAVYLLHRHPDIQEIRRAARDRCGVAGRPHPGRDRLRLILRPASSAANATSRPMSSKPRRCWPTPAAFRSTAIARADHGEFLPAVQ